MEIPTMPNHYSKKKKGRTLILPFSFGHETIFVSKSLPHQLANVVFHIVSKSLAYLLPPPRQDVIFCLLQIVCSCCSLIGNLPTNEESQLFGSWDDSIAARSWYDRLNLYPSQDGIPRWEMWLCIVLNVLPIILQGHCHLI